MEEDFIQNKFGYCFYSINLEAKYPVVIYNLYVYPKYRRKGNARKLLQYIINEIRYTGYTGEIEIEAKPKENSISLENLISFYKNMGLKIIKDNSRHIDN